MRIGVWRDESPSVRPIRGAPTVQREPDEYRSAPDCKAVRYLRWLCPHCQTLIASRATQEEAYARYIKHFWRAHGDTEQTDPKLPDPQKIASRVLMKVDRNVSEQPKNCVRPRSLVKCSECIAFVKSENLARHKAKAHPPKRTQPTRISRSSGTTLSRLMRQSRTSGFRVRGPFLQGGLCNGH